MKGRTLVRIGSVWLATIVILFLIAAFLPVFTDKFVGLGVELPIFSGAFTAGVSVSVALTVIFSLLLGWIPFVLIGMIRVNRERKARILDNPSLNS